MTTLRLYNTLSRSKEDFVPLDPRNVRMYVCGPTVYDFAHIGNARPAIVFDVLFRLLRHTYGAGHVTYVRNITDIDDKINARALERRGTRNVPILDVVRELTQETYRVYQEDVAALGCLPPTNMPRATEYVPQMIAMTQALIDAGFAYPAEGHVLFDVEKKKDYGKLARRSLDEMIAGARVDVAPYKKNPMDFVLWKPSDDSTPGWDSPWGRGRPGWHLECSSMIEGTFKSSDTIDIHGGGIDLVFPHHENEIAQSESAHHGHPLARYWMHNGFLNVEGEKMSKSLGNFVTINELLTRGWGSSIPWDGDTLRFAMLTTHYRQPIDWTLNRLLGAWYNLETFMSLSRIRLGFEYETDISVEPSIINKNVSQESLFHLADDLNTPAVISHLFHLAEMAKSDDDAGRNAAEQILTDCLFLGVDPYRSIRKLRSSHSLREIEEKIEARNAARKAKEFKQSDRIRDELLAQGIVLKDTPQGTTWEVKR